MEETAVSNRNISEWRLAKLSRAHASPPRERETNSHGIQIRLAHLSETSRGKSKSIGRQRSSFVFQRCFNPSCQQGIVCGTAVYCRVRFLFSRPQNVIWMECWMTQLLLSTHLNPLQQTYITASVTSVAEALRRFSHAGDAQVRFLTYPWGPGISRTGDRSESGELSPHNVPATLT